MSCCVLQAREFYSKFVEQMRAAYVPGAATMWDVLGAAGCQCCWAWRSMQPGTKAPVVSLARTVCGFQLALRATQHHGNQTELSPSTKSLTTTLCLVLWVAAGADRVQDGVFGAMMNVALENDGPVTFILDSGHQGSGHH